MARIPLTEQEAERIVQDRKRVGEDVQWRKADEGESWLKCELNVENSLRANLKLYLNWNTEEPMLFSFSLILSNAYRIRGLDFNGSHKNRHTDRKRWQSETHKHKWTDACRDSFAYTPNDITAELIEEVFRQFCVECNIEFTGGFSSAPPKQLNLPGSE